MAKICRWRFSDALGQHWRFGDTVGRNYHYPSAQKSVINVSINKFANFGALCKTQIKLLNQRDPMDINQTPVDPANLGLTCPRRHDKIAKLAAKYLKITGWQVVGDDT